MVIVFIAWELSCLKKHRILSQDAEGGSMCVIAKTKTKLVIDWLQKKNILDRPKQLAS